MAELKFISTQEGKAETPCSCPQPSGPRTQAAPPASLHGDTETVPRWVTGAVTTAAGPVPVVATTLTPGDLWGHVRCRVSAYRNDYAVRPGLYAVGAPDRSSEVLISANYKLSFDHLRRELQGLDVWILVLDTKGINVWCAAGKGTFGTEELALRIGASQLDRVVEHRRIIVPQLGAPGIAAPRVKRATGFRVQYGPVHAKDIRTFIEAGCRATQEMRTVRFTLLDRLVLTPMEINPAMKKYFPLYAAVILAVFGLQPSGIIFSAALSGGLPFLLLGLLSILAGAFLTPLMLPLIPFRSFAVKGWIVGLASVFAAVQAGPLFSRYGTVLHIITYLFFPLASSYVALQFTGATTFTGMSGVKKELKIAIPLYVSSAAISVVLLCLYKLGEWRIL
ncbi:MAG: mercury methylation corrinoid protein HgcA [Nitrospiraceae bacterium]|nr:mercury methylation corrinoid protein HgcA [Nitrospiraceae bacterium]